MTAHGKISFRKQVLSSSALLDFSEDNGKRGPDYQYRVKTEDCLIERIPQRQERPVRSKLQRQNIARLVVLPNKTLIML